MSRGSAASSTKKHVASCGSFLKMSSTTPSLTPSMLAEKPSPPWMSSMCPSDRDEFSMDSEVRDLLEFVLKTRLDFCGGVLGLALRLMVVERLWG